MYKSYKVQNLPLDRYKCIQLNNKSILKMENEDLLTILSHEKMKVASMGAFSQDKEDFFIMLLKNVISQKVILNVPFLFNEKDLDWNQPFAQITRHYLDMKKRTDLKQQRLWDNVKKIAKNALNGKRSNITCGLKKIFLGTYKDRLM